MSATRPCGDCRATGKIQHPYCNDHLVCGNCNGTGREAVPTDCARCNGTGWHGEGFCGACLGCVKDFDGPVVLTYKCLLCGVDHPVANGRVHHTVFDGALSPQTPPHTEGE